MSQGVCEVRAGFLTCCQSLCSETLLGIVAIFFDPDCSLQSGNALIALVICLSQVISEHAQAWHQIRPSFFFIDKMDYFYLHFISHLLISLNNRKILIYIQHYQLYYHLNLTTHVFCIFSAMNICLRYSNFITISTSVLLFWLPVALQGTYLDFHIWCRQLEIPVYFWCRQLEITSMKIWIWS